ncbi:hypothetical protein JYT59_01765 [Sphingobacteriaceae bacterium AH-315-L07]|nr:hypothetical protein [Sphingobacteriaceae bacterium AH-315-L07]
MTKKEIKDFRKKVYKGVKIAIKNALLEHKKAGRSIVIMRDGKIVTVPPEEILVSKD